MWSNTSLGDELWPSSQSRPGLTACGWRHVHVFCPWQWALASAKLGFTLNVGRENPTQSTNQIQPVQFPRCDNMPWPAAASLPTPFLNHRLQISCKCILWNWSGWWFQVYPKKMNHLIKSTYLKIRRPRPTARQGGAGRAHQRRSMLKEDFLQALVSGSGRK